MAKLFDPLTAEPIVCTVMHYLITFCSQPEAASDVISDAFVHPILPHVTIIVIIANTVHEKCDPQPSVVAFSIVFRSNFQLEVASDVLSNVGVD